MIAEQYEAGHPRPIVETLKSGERVIKDPVLTISVIYMRYYLFINIGSLVGQISMVYVSLPLQALDISILFSDIWLGGEIRWVLSLLYAAYDTIPLLPLRAVGFQE